MVAEELKLIVKAEVDEATRKLRDFQAETKSSSQAGQDLRDSFSAFATGVNQSLEILSKVGGAIREVINAAERVAVLDQVAVAFRNVTREAGVNADELLTSLREASAGTIKTVDLMKAASRANLFGLPMEKLGDLMKIARASAQATGQDMTYMFDSIVTGIGRASPLIIDNLGIKVSLTEVNKKFAESLGVEVDALTDAQRSQALLNAVLENGQEIIRKVGSRSETTAEKIGALKTTMSEVADTVIKDAVPNMGVLHFAVKPVADEFVRVRRHGDAVDKTIEAIGTQAEESGKKLNIFAQGILKIIGGLIQSQSIAPLKSIGPQSSLKPLEAIGEIAGGAADYARYLEAATGATQELVNEWDEGANVILAKTTNVGDAFAVLNEQGREILNQWKEAGMAAAEAIGTALVNAEDGAEALKAIAKDLVATLLRTMAEMLFTQAGAAFAGGLFPQAAALSAAGAAALVAAGVVTALKEGGIVTRPTQALIGEAGPEAVIPLDKMGKMGNTYITVMGNVWRENDLHEATMRYSNRAYAPY